MFLLHNFYLRYDVAKLMNMDYSNDVQKKLVDKIASQLPCDEDWDDDDEWQKAYKSCGLKRFRIDKQLLSCSKETEEHTEVIESSSSKDGKGAMKSLFDKADPEVKIKIQNPEFVDLGNHVRTTKSAADAVAALIAQMKRLLPSLQVISGDAGVQFRFSFIFFKCKHFLFCYICCIFRQDLRRLVNASIASSTWMSSMRSSFFHVQNLTRSQQMTCRSSQSSRLTQLLSMRRLRITWMLASLSGTSSRTTFSHNEGFIICSSVIRLFCK